MYYSYIKYNNETQKTDYCPKDDYDGSITGTGKCILNVKAWFDENPEERKRLGWIKEITPDINEDNIQYDRQTQFITWSLKQVDQYTIEHVPHVCNKSEEMMRLEELLNNNTDARTQTSGLIFTVAPY